MDNLLDGLGRVLRWPKKNADKIKVLDYLAEKFEFNRIYREAEVNDILKQYHIFYDWALLRRELFERLYFDRNPRQGTYWRRSDKADDRKQ